MAGSTFGKNLCAANCRKRTSIASTDSKTKNAKAISDANAAGAAAKTAQDKAAAGATRYLNTKLVTGRFFMERLLPETAVHLARIQSGSATTMELAAEAF